MSDFPGYVAKLITSEELIINLGTTDNVTVGDRFAIIDTRAHDIADPVTGENLGSIDRFKAQVEVIKPGERISLARKIKRGSPFATISELVSGTSLSVPSSSRGPVEWSEGVEVGDPVVRVNVQKPEKD